VRWTGKLPHGKTDSRPIIQLDVMPTALAAAGIPALPNDSPHYQWDYAALVPLLYLDPNAEVSADYWTLRARTKAGQPISGIRLNEDTHSYQFRDKTGLHSVFKKDLAEHEIVKTSPMPSYQGKLSDRDFEDLIAYLAARREGDRP